MRCPDFEPVIIRMLGMKLISLADMLSPPKLLDPRIASSGCAHFPLVNRIFSNCVHQEAGEGNWGIRLWLRIPSEQLEHTSLNVNLIVSVVGLAARVLRVDPIKHAWKRNAFPNVFYSC